MASRGRANAPNEVTHLRATLDELPPADYHIPPPKLSLVQHLAFDTAHPLVREVRKTAIGLAMLIWRHPTQEEVNALSDMIYQGARTTAWSLPVAVTATILLARRGRSTYRFPFYQPKFTLFDPNRFPAPNMAYLHGEYANRMWHNVRLALYMTASWCTVFPLLKIYAHTASMWSFSHDDRLSQLREDREFGGLNHIPVEKAPMSYLLQLRNQYMYWMKDAERKLSKYCTPEENAPGQRPALTGKFPIGWQKQARLQDLLAKNEWRRKVLVRIEELIALKGNGSSESDIASQIRDYEALGAPDAAGIPFVPAEFGSSSRPNYGPSRETPEDRSGLGQQGLGKADTGDLDYDDASPVATTSNSMTQQTGSSGSAGSAWDRLRQSAKGQSGASGSVWKKAQGQQGQSERTSEDYTYDRAEEERALAKDKAQREFDEMIERERKADEGQGGGRNSRW